jgi:hypothetical protein
MNEILFYKSNKFSNNNTNRYFEVEIGGVLIKFKKGIKYSDI